ncbi:hypothetical protein [Xanthobacter autotrophicus]|uniref:hypothetical protein n=1 Tax=Xanthobacter autotrophicus TaxID=280 RepID=UPI00372994AA
MAAPWLTSSKSINLSGQTARTHPLCPATGFVPAPLQGSLSFPPSKLYAALAKTTMLSSANMTLTSALLHSDQVLIEALVDDLGSDFLFTSDMAHLGSDMRKALMGRIGAALCHLYLDQLGYAWLDYANQYIATALPLADFVYDGANIGSRGLALAEAKGSMTTAASAQAAKTKADKAYNRQVSNHLGQMTSAGRIEYGCAIASAILPANAWSAGQTSCFFHVTETVPSVPAGSGPGGGPLAGSNSGGAGGDDDGADDLSTVSCRIALRNYRAVFRLINAPYLAGFLDALLAGIPYDAKFEQRFGRLSGPSDRAQWVVGEPHGHPMSLWYENANRLSMGGYRFALHERSFTAIKDLITDCSRDRGLLEETVRLPNLSRPERFADERDREERLVPTPFFDAPLGDGLAAVKCDAASYSDEENFRWPG